MPLLKAKLALNNLEENQTLQLLATDPVSERDLTAYCEQKGYVINLVVLDNKVFQYLITKLG